MDQGLVVIAPARKAGDAGSIPGPGENFSLKLLIIEAAEMRFLRPMAGCTLWDKKKK